MLQYLQKNTVLLHLCGSMQHPKSPSSRSKADRYRILTVGSLIKDEFVVALGLADTATDEEQSLFGGLGEHGALAGGIVGQNDVLHRLLRVVAQRAHAHRLVVFPPVGRRTLSHKCFTK